MNKFRITEMRQNEKGEYFAIDTYIEAENIKELKKSIDNCTPSWIKDKNYRIKELYKQTNPEGII